MITKPIFFRSVAAALVLMLFKATPVSAQVEQPLDSALSARLDSMVRWEMGRQDIIGMAVAVIRGGKIAFVNAYGFSDWENQKPVTLESEFRWASMSKSLTSVAAAKLQEQGLLEMDTFVRTYIPEWPDSLLRVRQLLQNRSGIGHYNELDRLFPSWKKNLRQYKPDTLWKAQDAISIFKGTPLVFKPDSSYMYSTFGFILAGAVLDQIGQANLGLGYLGLIHQYIVQPFGLLSLKPDFQTDLNPNEVKGYYRDRKGDIRQRKDDDISWKIPGGGYQSNIVDLAKYVQALMQRKVLRPESFQPLWTRQPDWDYGMGFEVRGEGSEFQIAHSGSQTKTRTIFEFYPNRQLGVAVMCNSEWANPSQVAERLINTLRAADEGAGASALPGSKKK